MGGRPDILRRGWRWVLAAACVAGVVPSVALACFSPTSVDAVPGSLVSVPWDARFMPGTPYKAHYENLTDRYAHGVLGDALEPETLGVQTIRHAGDCAQVMRVTLDKAHVFEDVAPRLYDLDGDLSFEVITVQSHKDKGARLAVYGFGPDGRFGLRATTPYIGTRNRWLAPVRRGRARSCLRGCRTVGRFLGSGSQTLGRCRRAASGEGGRRPGQPIVRRRADPDRLWNCCDKCGRA